jgi:hypothetical protein
MEIIKADFATLVSEGWVRYKLDFDWGALILMRCVWWSESAQNDSLWDVMLARASPLGGDGGPIVLCVDMIG